MEGLCYGPPFLIADFRLPIEDICDCRPEPPDSDKIGNWQLAM
jgi:hypothetical protein